MSAIARCKMRLESKITNESPNGSYISVQFKPVTNGSAENKEFWKYTPSGVLSYETINEGAASKLVVGKEYYVDVIPADAS